MAKKKTKLAGDAAGDHVSRIAAQWLREMPEVKTDGMAIIGRARRLTLLSRTAIEGVFARHGLDTGEFDVLATLRRSGAPFALRPTELFRTLMISSGGLTDRLARLEKRGLVVRDASEKDKRSLIVRLTAKGKKIIEEAFAADMAIENGMIAPLSKEERETLARLLAKLLAPLEKSAEEGRD